MNYRRLFKTKRLKKCGNDEIMEVAFHEAGHALIDLLYGLIPPEATVVPNNKTKTDGSVARAVQAEIVLPSGEKTTVRFEDIQQYFELVCEIEISTEKALEYHIIDQLAGIISGAIYSGKYDWKGANKYLDSMMDYLIHFGYYEIPPLQPYWDKTFELLKENEGFLYELAILLYTEKTMTIDHFKAFKSKMFIRGHIPLI